MPGWNHVRDDRNLLDFIDATVANRDAFWWGFATVALEPV